MLNQFSRTQLLIGKDNMDRLKNARVAVFGIGGVGGYTVEALARSGVGTLDLIDDDKVCLTNLNRQILATRKTIGKYKVDVAKERILDINPDAVVNTYKTFFMPDTAEQFDFSQYDYVVDAIDTVTGKLMLVEQAQASGTPIISSMGAGNKMDPTGFMVTDIYKTSVCPLAKVMRRELKKRGIKKICCLRHIKSLMDVYHCVRIDLKDTFSGYIHLIFANCFSCCINLTVNVGQTYFIVINKIHCSDTASHQRFYCISANSAVLTRFLKWSLFLYHIFLAYQ